MRRKVFDKLLDESRRGPGTEGGFTESNVILIQRGSETRLSFKPNGKGASVKPGGGKGGP